MPRLAQWIAVSLCAGLTATSQAQEPRWGTPDDPLVKFMVQAETKWAQLACGPQPDLKDLIADDYQGTSTKGERYGKRDAITPAPGPLARDCRIGEIKIQFFGDTLAVAYGAESRVQPGSDGKDAKRCQVWTDTWLKRGGRWQIIAAQDGLVACSP